MRSAGERLGCEACGIGNSRIAGHTQQDSVSHPHVQELTLHRSGDKRQPLLLRMLGLAIIGRLDDSCIYRPRAYNATSLL